MGVWRERGRLRISSAVSKPSISGIRTSRRMTAKSSLRRWRRASLPEFANTSSSPNTPRVASRETRFSGVSSTRRIFIFSSEAISGAGCKLWAVTEFPFLSGNSETGRRQFVAANQPDAQHGEELVEVNRLGDVIGGARL